MPSSKPKCVDPPHDAKSRFSFGTLERSDLILVDPLDLSDAVEVLEKKLESTAKRNDKDYAESAAALDFIPLTIVQEHEPSDERCPKYTPDASFGHANSQYPTVLIKTSYSK